jgi:hypothetical protein
VCLIATAAKEYTPSLEEGPSAERHPIDVSSRHRVLHYTIQQLFWTKCIAHIGPVKSNFGNTIAFFISDIFVILAVIQPLFVLFNVKINLF